jgi:RHS repeat-associated protein
VAARKLWVEHGPEGLEAVPYRFTGKELDEETGLYYYGARYLNPRTSRWVSADPAGPRLMDPKEKKYSLISGLNWYSYVDNNPLRYSDPTGLGGQDEVESLWTPGKEKETRWKGQSLVIFTEGDEQAVPILELRVAAEKQTWYRGMGRKRKVMSEGYTGKIAYELLVNPKYSLEGKFIGGYKTAGGSDAPMSELWFGFKGTLSKEGDVLGELIGMLYDLSFPTPQGGTLVNVLSFLGGAGSAMEHGKEAAGSVRMIDMGVYFGIVEALDLGEADLGKLQGQMLMPQLQYKAGGQVNMRDYTSGTYSRQLQ